ncbi:MAG: 1-phosphofructokinase family hexose kinase [Propionibacteriaceae bacterium]|nr:1-phosphofructokinase family hexose kinase [Propionibacteriaceae bacterium]
MIITFTANPSIDRSAPLAGQLRVGRVNRLGEVYSAAAGKGVNVSAAVRAAGHPTTAIVPVDASDPLAEALRARGVPARMVPVGRRARTNLTITHPDGHATRFNEPGEPLTPENQTALVSALLATLPGASWLALCGSLPPGSPVDWYVSLTRKAHSIGVKVAVDATGPALEAVIAAAEHTSPDLVSPNVAELQQATGRSIRPALKAGDVGPAVDACRGLLDRGVTTVLATLGKRGALLACSQGVWHASAEPVRAVSVVGAGDASLAGYLLARVAGGDPVERLCRAVAYGTASVLLPGSDVPQPSDADAVDVRVEQLV